MKIRKANLKDLKRIAELLHEYDLYENRLDKRHRIDKISEIISFNKRVIKHPNAVFFVLEIDRRIQGVVSGEWRETAIGKTSIIHQIIISEKFRGKGYGTRLLSEIEEYFKRIGCKTMKSFVFINNKRSAKLYKRLNYKLEEGYSITKKLK